MNTGQITTQVPLGVSFSTIAPAQPGQISDTSTAMQPDMFSDILRGIAQIGESPAMTEKVMMATFATTIEPVVVDLGSELNAQGTMLLDVMQVVHESSGKQNESLSKVVEHEKTSEGDESLQSSDVEMPQDAIMSAAGAMLVMMPQFEGRMPELLNQAPENRIPLQHEIVFSAVNNSSSVDDLTSAVVPQSVSSVTSVDLQMMSKEEIPSSTFVQMAKVKEPVNQQEIGDSEPNLHEKSISAVTYRMTSSDKREQNYRNEIPLASQQNVTKQVAETTEVVDRTGAVLETYYQTSSRPTPVSKPLVAQNNSAAEVASVTSLQKVATKVLPVETLPAPKNVPNEPADAVTAHATTLTKKVVPDVVAAVRPQTTATTARSISETGSVLPQLAEKTIAVPNEPASNITAAETKLTKEALPDVVAAVRPQTTVTVARNISETGSALPQLAEKTIAVPNEPASAVTISETNLTKETLPHDVAAVRPQTTVIAARNISEAGSALPQLAEKSIAVPNEAASAVTTSETNLTKEALTRDVATVRPQTTVIAAHNISETGSALPQNAEKSVAVPNEALPHDVMAVRPQPAVITTSNTLETNSALSQLAEEPIMEVRHGAEVVRNANGTGVVASHVVGKVAQETVPLQQIKTTVADIQKEQSVTGMAIPSKVLVTSDSGETATGNGNDSAESNLNSQAHLSLMQHKAEQPVSGSARFSQVIHESTTDGTMSSVAQQVKEHLSRHEFKAGTEQISIRLTPENMGELKLNFVMDNKQLKVEIVADSNMVRDSLLKHSDALKETLAKQNITMESFNVSTGTNGGSSGRDQSDWRELAKQRQYNNLWTQSDKEYRAADETSQQNLKYQAKAAYSMLDVHF